MTPGRLMASGVLFLFGGYWMVRSGVPYGLPKALGLGSVFFGSGLLLLGYFSSFGKKD